MGNKESRPSIIPYEDAIKRVSDEEFKRLREAFKRYSTPAGYMSRPVFVKDVLGDGMPTKLGEHLYFAFGGNNKGLIFKELFSGMVLLAKGSQTEKLKFIFALCACQENGMYISQEDVEQFISTCDGNTPPQEVAQLFREDDRVSYEQFCSWLLKHSHVMKLSAWLLQDSNKPGLRLSDESDTPTFYQTLAGVTHLEETDIIELEKKYWALQAQSKTGRFDLDTFMPLISPPMPKELCEGVFNAFDVNSDNHIDLKEMACGLSACCRGPRIERQKFFFKIFDADQDSLLNRDELEKMVQSLLNVRRENRVGLEVDVKSVENLDPVDIAADILANHDGDKDGCITQEEFQMWAIKNSLPDDFCKLLFQVCHIILGLRPQTTEEEKEVILGWVEREKRRGLRLTQTWYLISMNWWRTWNHYVSHKPPFSNQTLNHSKMTSPNASGTLGRQGTQAWSETKSRSPLLSRRGTHSNGSSSAPNSPTRSPKKSGPGNQGSLGPPKPGLVDNTLLIMPDSRKVGTLTNEGGRLKRNPPLMQGKDYEIIPEPVWKALSQWYAGGPSLPRNVIVPLEGEPSASLELYPISVRLLRHQTVQQRQNAWNGVNIGNVSIGASGISFSQNSNSTPPAPKRYLAHTACFSKMHTMQQVYEFLSGRLRIRSEEMRLWNLKDENNPILLEDDSSTLEQQNITEDQNVLIEVRNKDLSWPEEMSLLAKSKQDNKKQVVRTESGLTGMSNLGNTCFMNAAIQCISNTQPLTLYFKTDSFLYELNSTNPLGMKGHIAKRYGDLVRELWAGNAKSVAPLKLRWTIAKYAPRFNGFQQQDSQELLAFLLDGLHEDLNRVQEKPYVELKDSDGRPDEEVSQEAWENHLRRNQSVIVDLFQGQLKSQVRCKTCGHTSVRFDPFIFLSLPLPMESSMHVEIVVVRLDGSVPIKYGLRLNMEAKYKAFKKQLGELCDLQLDQLLLVEVGGAMVRSFPTDAQKIRTLLGGILYCYEIPLISPSPSQQNTTVHNTIHSDSLTNLQTLPPINSPTPNDLTITTPPPNGVIQGNHGIGITGYQATSISMINMGGSNGGGVVKQNGEVGQGRLNGDVVTEKQSTTQSPVKQHSRTPSTASANSSVGASPTAVHNFEGFVVAVHRKMIRMDMYFLSWQKSRPCLFGIPIILPCLAGATSHEELYSSVWMQVSRLVSSTAPMENGHKNHAEDGDSPRHSYPFTLKAVQKDGITCAWCPWYRFCRGCEISCCSDPFTSGTTFLAIDWDPTALHLRYQTSQERVVTEHESVEKSRRLQSEPISLDDCLRAFTKEEELGEDELYYCSKCKHHRLAVKKLDIWRLPPILVIHLKRFQFVNGRWVKSQKIVKFPKEDFDPSNFLAPRHPVAFRNLVIGRQRPRSEMMEVIDIAQEGAPEGDVDSLNSQGGLCVNAIKMNDESKDQTKHGEKSSSECTCGDSALVNGHSDGQEETVRCGGAGRTGIPCSGRSGKRPRNLILKDSKTHPESQESAGDAGMSEETDGMEREALTRQRSLLSPRMDATDSHPLLKGETEDDRDENGHLQHMYELYGVACHTGILGGGHYVAYAVNPNKKWYCFNDSSVKEVKEEIDMDNAYMLFYERKGLGYADFIPDIIGKEPDTTPIDDDIEADYKRFCVIQ
ncbi:ubiquitin carboxyl-terminal hydrolase 32-like isoform X1 [Asterias rubens]|uniref:ubiquitin carboxyl-terminal hydrolase 32-like isoform X1 n=1 Tax=Asterias rubens TaxID=7604 RepID=UPI001455C2E5|nr:ubiquitin carboxyl-terminal hydrolase 32-like isoform X1 [Asterias rubens]